MYQALLLAIYLAVVLIQIISISCITLFTVLGLFLLFDKKAVKGGHQWLGLFFVLLGVNFLDGNLLMSGFYMDYPQFAFWEDSAAFLYGPIILFYTRRLISGPLIMKWTDLIHIIPFLSLLSITIVTFQTQSAEFKISVLSSIVTLQASQNLFIGMLAIFLHFFAYVLYAKRLVSAYSKNLQDYYSSLDISWLNKSLDLLLIIFLISLGATLLQFFGPKGSFEIALLIVMITMLLFITKVLLAAISKPLFTEQLDLHQNQSNPLTPEEITEIRAVIIEAVEEHKKYLVPDLTLDELAREINVQGRKVSHVINTSFSQNFYEFVNSFRIKEAQRILRENDDPKLTVLEVMYQVGFNSKSSFNTQFKKAVGLTPTEYRRSHK